jgi:alkylation response protein AidB-like acyl-CoA dehydrogenase
MPVVENNTKKVTKNVTVQELLERVPAIAPILEAGARESEDAARLAEASVRALLEHGFFRLWWPPELGGPGADVAGGIAVIDALAEVDTAAAWNLAVGTTSAGFAGAYLSDEAVRSIFTGEDVVIAGQMAPIGKAQCIDGGLRASGRWSFGSGIHQSRWVLGGAVLADEQAPRPIIVVAPISDAKIDDSSWQVVGLSGTGSCDYVLDDVFIPEGYWADFPSPRRLRGHESFDLPVPGQVMVLHAGFALGAARRVMTEITELAQKKVRAFTKGSVAQNTTFQRELAEAHARLAGASLYVYEVAARMQAAIGRPDLAAAILEGRAASRYATDVALDIATWAYRRGGGTSLRLQNPLQRILRDLLAASQHAYVEETAYTAMGGDMIGLQP